MVKRRFFTFALGFVLWPCIGCGSKPPYEGKTVAQLRKMLQSPEVATQAQGAFGLSLHGAAAEPAAEALGDALRSSAPLVRQNAALALGKIGPGASAELPKLVAALQDAEWPVRRQAALSLSALGPAARFHVAVLAVAGPIVTVELQHQTTSVARPATSQP